MDAMSGSASDKSGDATASRALLTAALGGLLCVGMPACSATDPGSDTVAPGGRPDAALASPAVQPDAGVGLDASVDLDASAADAAAGDAAPACEGGPGDAAPIITSSTIVPDLTLEDFTAECDKRGGTVEIHPHCGGENTCRGMSYDTGTQTLTEHTCRGMNVCAGFSCVICD